MDIADWRIKIDQLDEQIVRLINERAAAAVEIGRIKATQTAPIYEPKREQQVYEHIERVNQGPLTGTELKDIYERLIDVMRAKQKPAQR